jgi:hypothetical protein
VFDSFQALTTVRNSGKLLASEAMLESVRKHLQNGNGNPAEIGAAEP